MIHQNKLWILLLFSMMISCKKSETSQNVTNDPSITIDNNGVNIEYEDSGLGDTTLLLVHGWGINKEYWVDQVKYFSDEYRVVTVDLPGFGQSGKNRKNWSVEEYGKDLTKVINKLDLENVIIVGHSMSGAIVLETALKNPEKIIGVVSIDNFKNTGVPVTAESKAENEKIFASIRARFKASIAGYANQALFSKETDTLIKQRVVNDMISSDSIIAVDCMEEGEKYPLDDKLRSLDKTLYLINSTYYPTDTVAFTRNKIDFKLFQQNGVGHYGMIEKPDDFNLLLNKVIRDIKQ